MPLPADFAPKWLRLRRNVQVFRDATAGGELSAAQVKELGKVLQSIVELLEMAGRCCERKSGDIKMKGKNILQN